MKKWVCSVCGYVLKAQEDIPKLEHDYEGVPTKPDPTSFLDIASNLGFTAENTIMIGDSEPDINVANNAGANCIAVTWGYRTREQLEATGTKTIIDHPHELLEILK